MFSVIQVMYLLPIRWNFPHSLFSLDIYLTFIKDFLFDLLLLPLLLVAGVGATVTKSPSTGICHTNQLLFQG